MELTSVDQVRRFNRTVTQRVGALEDAFLARARPLGQARLLWEIGTGGAEVRALRARLGLDSGYLSRLLRALEADGLIAVETGGDDGRVRRARLTPAGLAERAELDRRSDDLATSILRPLNARQRDRLVAAMADVERLLTASMVDIAAVDPRHPHARYCVGAYFAELAERFEGGFDPTLSISAGDDELTPPAGLLLVASLHGEPVGCVALKLDRAGSARSGSAALGSRGSAALERRGSAARGVWAEVKRMWVAPEVRGLGLGRRLLAEVEARAADLGVRALRLETNGALTEAIALYRAAGYREVDPFNTEPYAHHWFEKRI